MVGPHLPEAKRIEIVSHLLAGRKIDWIVSASCTSRGSVSRLKQNLLTIGKHKRERTRPRGPPRRISPWIEQQLREYLRCFPDSHQSEIVLFCEMEYGVLVSRPVLSRLLKPWVWPRRKAGRAIGERLEARRAAFRSRSVERNAAVESDDLETNLFAQNELRSAIPVAPLAQASQCT